MQLGTNNCHLLLLRRAQPNTYISWPRLALALLVANAAQPICAALTLLTTDVQWAGSTYSKRRGRITRVGAGAAGVAQWRRRPIQA